MGNICINILCSVIMGFITPLVFSAAAAVMGFIFNTFTRPFQFTYEQGTNWFVDMLGTDLLNIVVKIMIGAGVVLAIFLLAVNIFKLFFAGISKRVDSPIALCIRAVMSIFLSYWIIDIVYKVIFPMFQWLLDKVNNITVNSGKTATQAISDMFSLTQQTSASDFGLSEGTSFVDKLAGAFVGASNGSVGEIITGIVFIVFFIKSIIALFKLVTEMAERYLLVNVLTVCSPMIMPTIISNGTMQIFVSWIRMMVANCLVLIFNSLGMIMLNVAFINVGNCCTAIIGVSGSGRWMRPITAMVVYVALIKVVEKFDVYLAQLAFKIQAIGGDNKGMTVAGLLALGDKANRKAAQVAQAGGIKNAIGERVGNFLGVLTGNRDGFAGRVSQGAQDYRAYHAASERAKAGAKFGASDEGMKVAQQNLETELKQQQNPDFAEKKMQIEAQKALNNADAMKNPNYRKAKTTEGIAQLGLKTNMLKNSDYVDALTQQDTAKNEAEATKKLNPDYIESDKKLTLANEFAKGQINDDSAVQTIKVENEARSQDIRSRAAATEIGIEAQARNIETSDKVHEKVQQRRADKHSQDEEDKFLNESPDYPDDK